MVEWKVELSEEYFDFVEKHIRKLSEEKPLSIGLVSNDANYGGLTIRDRFYLYIKDVDLCVV